MASSNEINGGPVSAAMLMDPKALKKHLTNGISFPSYFELSPPTVRRSSEPPPSLSISPQNSIDSSTVSKFAKDDAYPMLEGKGKKGSGAHQPGQTTSSHFDARRLLDPAGFDSTKHRSISTDPMLEDKKTDIEVRDTGLSKRDRDEYEGQGMGSLIERVHNVSGREERPQKKQKSENFQDDRDKIAIHGGGGKGGEIGEYMRQKKKEGIAESGAATSIVDLTGGRCLDCLRSFQN